MEWYSKFLNTLTYLDSLSDERLEGWLTVKTPYFAIACVLVYLIFVTIGPDLMRNKAAFNIKHVIIWYNFLLVIWSGYMFILFVRYGIFVGNFNMLCYTVNYSHDYEPTMLAWALYIFYISKLVELLDTVFFILRKKNNQVSFLHVYHHASMPILWWFGIKFVAGGEGYLSPMVNCFVHVCMYAYYALSALGPWIQPYLWWKKYITMLQMIQFVIVITKTVVTLIVTCSYPNVYLWGQLVYMLSLLVLFLDFYRQTYKHKKNEKSSKTVEVEHSSNGGAKLNHVFPKSLESTNDAVIKKR